MFCLSVVAIGKPKACASVMAAFMSWNESVTASRKTRPMMPEIQIAPRTPRGARRAGVDGLLAEGAGGIEAVDHEERHQRADQEDGREVAVGQVRRVARCR